MTSSSKRASLDALALPDALAAELAALGATALTLEARASAVNGRGGLRGRYSSRVDSLRWCRRRRGKCSATWPIRSTRHVMTGSSQFCRPPTAASMSAFPEQREGV